MSKKLQPPVAARKYFDETRDYLALVDAEVSFFSALIKNKSELIGNHSVFQALNSALHFLGDPNGRQLDIMVEFHVNDPRSLQAQNIYLGTKLCPGGASSDPLATHFFCLGDGTNLLTKNHHDRDFNPGASEKKPLSHIQMGGGVSQYLATKGGTSCWREDVSKPRIPSFPICSALLWHWAFLEYRNAEQIAPICGAHWWKKIIQTAEKAVLKPFFEDGAQLLVDHIDKGLLNALYVPLAK